MATVERIAHLVRTNKSSAAEDKKVYAARRYC